MEKLERPFTGGTAGRRSTVQTGRPAGPVWVFQTGTGTGRQKSGPVPSINDTHMRFHKI